MGVVSKRQVWLESMGVVSGYGCKELHNYIDIPTPLVSAVFFAKSSLLFVHFITFFIHLNID